MQSEEAAPEHMSLDIESGGDDGDDGDNVAQIYFDPALVDIPEGFNDD